MDAASTLRKRPLSVRTTAKLDVEGRSADNEAMGEPVSPSARLFEDYFIVVIMGLSTPVNLPVLRAGIRAKLTCYPRFNRIQVTDKEGILRWVRTPVDMDDHIIYPRLDQAAVEANPDLAVEDFVASLSTKPMDHRRPLWEFHVLDFPTSDATSTVVMRMHHSLGDGMSVLLLLLACSRSSADPTRAPALPPLPARTGGFYERPRPPLSAGALAFAIWLWSFVVLAWHTVWDAASFFATVLFLKDTDTLFTRMNNGNSQRMRIVHRSLSLDDVKMVKDTMHCTVNDVLVGLADAALSRYYYRKSGETETGKKIRLRSVLPVNIRAASALHACVNMIESGKGSDVRWGNQVSFVILPVHIALHRDPLDYVRKAKNTVDRKKNSMEVAFTHVAAELLLKIFGTKAGGAIINRALTHTTTMLSNMIGPVEEVEFCGHPVVFVAPSAYGLPQAITIYYNSYVDTVRVVLGVEEAQFLDCHELLKDFTESLRCIKQAATSLSRSIT